jgi:hypothetical protein
MNPTGYISFRLKSESQLMKSSSSDISQPHRCQETDIDWFSVSLPLICKATQVRFASRLYPLLEIDSTLSFITFILVLIYINVECFARVIIIIIIIIIIIKAILVTGCGGLEGCEMSRIPHCLDVDS